jgi:hypothetical protein
MSTIAQAGRYPHLNDVEDLEKYRPGGLGGAAFTQYRLETPLLEADIRFYTSWGTGVQRSTFLHGLACSGPIATRAIV